MTEQQAQKEGLRFTGIYDRSYNHEKLKGRAKQIRDQGFRAVVCRVPDNKLSRGPRGVGYSVFAEDAFFDTERLKALNVRLEGFDMRRQTILDEYHTKLANINAEQRATLDELDELSQRLTKRTP